VHKADNLPSSCAIVTISGNLNFLESSGPLRACNGTAVPFLLLLRTSKVIVFINVDLMTSVSGSHANEVNSKSVICRRPL